ncbi:MAG: pilus assembly protein PilM [Clostridiales bacterium]|nr:pilus assembly protein PilM [Clostridiales bacterium]
MGRKVLGLEIAARELNVVLVKNGAHPQLIYSDISSVPFLKGDTLADDDSEIAGVLLHVKELVTRQAKLKKADAVAFCVNDPQTVVRHVTIPVMPKKEILAAVEYELSQSFPGVGKSHAISFKEYSRAKNQIKGIASLSPKRNLEGYRKLIDQMGFKNSYIDVVSNADAKAFSAFAQSDRKNETALICNIGSASTHFTILQGKRVLQSRQIPDGFRQIRETVCGRFGINQNEYETIMQADPYQLNMPNRDISAITAAGYANIGEQLRQTIEFYDSDQNDAETISKVYLTGIGSVFPMLGEIFEAELPIPVSAIRLAAGVPADAITFAKTFSVIGAAIRED